VNPPRRGSGDLRLEPLALWLRPRPGQPLLPQLRAALSGTPGAQPLRWAVTAVDPDRGLRVEGVLVIGAMAAAED
jgi:hypothetical protein